MDQRTNYVDLSAHDEFLSDSSTEPGDSPDETPRFIDRHATERRNGRIAFPHISVDKITSPRNIRLKVGDTVELESDYQDTEIFRDGDFLRIHYIIEDCATGKIHLRGWRFRRNSLMVGRTVPPLLNEVTMLIDQEMDDERDPFVQAMETVPIDKVYKKRLLVLTNKAFPAYSFRTHTPYSSDGPNAASIKKSIRDSSELVCRWVALSRFDDSVCRQRFYKELAKSMEIDKTKVTTDGQVRRLRAAEADHDHAVRDSILVLDWLGYFPWHRTTAGGGRVQSHRTAADICCGGGFASLGLKQAGFKVEWALDINEHAVASYKLNHPDTTVYCTDVGEMSHFVVYAEHHVEILHCSLPCQWFSPAHTHEGANDEANTAAVFALRELLLRLKPRVVSFEQTSGLLTHHPDWFQAVIRMFTDNGYSVAWKKMNLAKHGLAHHRQRLILLASCPGSALPPFPEPTHGPNTYFPYVTIAEALGPLERSTTPISHHNPTSMAHLDLPPYSPHTQLQNTLTTSGTINYHYSGQRKYTVREAAVFQTAPLDFKFPAYLVSTEVMRQIGNAFPTTPACAVFTSVIMALDKEDEEMSHEQWD